MATYRNDPRWIDARYCGHCASCGKEIVRGDRIFYWPIGKKAECGECGGQSSARFAAECWDEEFGV